MTPWPFDNLRMFGYGVILADPAWLFENYSERGEGKNATRHYDCMTTAEMAKLPVRDLAAPDCALVMWATSPMLEQALWLMKQWGFTYKALGAWAKQSSTGRRWQFGPGYILRTAMEPYIVGTIGNPQRTSRSVRNLIVAPVREHSRKPEQIYADLEALYDGPRCELFARQRRPGWEAWGNQTDKFVEAA